MGAHRTALRTERPDVQVVQVTNTRDALDRGHHRVRLQVRWRRLHQDVERRRENAPRAPRDERGDGDAQQWVDREPVGRGDHQPGDDDAGRRPGIAPDVHQGALDREIALQRLQRPGDEQRDEQPDDGRRRHQSTAHLAGVLQPANGLDDDPDDDRPEQQGIHERYEDPHALIAEGAPGGGRALHLAQRERREGQHHQVGDDMTGIAEQGEAVRPEPANHFDHQDGGGEEEGQPNSSGGAGAHGGELHRPYLIAHWRIILTILYLPRRQDNDSTGTSFRIIFSVLSKRGSVPPELDRVLRAIEELSAGLTPAPIAVEPVGELVPDVFAGWRRLAAGVVSAEDDLRGLDPWAQRRLGELVALEAASVDAASSTTLVHAHARADNILLTPSRVIFIDWPWASLGAPWVDLLFMLPSVAMQRGPQPWEIFDAHALGRRAAVTAVVAAVAGFMIRGSRLPPPPGLPTVRAFQRDQGLPALQ